jgi:AcrR family transcriptional regulator
LNEYSFNKIKKYMPRTKEQFNEMRDKSRKLIMNSALKLFSANGFHATSISKIAADAGIATGLVYNYFTSKEDLLDKIVKDVLTDFPAVVNEFITDGLDSDNFNKLIDAVFTMVKEKKESWRLIISIMLQPDVAEIGRKNISQFSDKLAQLYESYFRKKGDKSAKKKVRLLLELLHAAILSFIISENEEVLDLIKDELIKKIII